MGTHTKATKALKCILVLQLLLCKKLKKNRCEDITVTTTEAIGIGHGIKALIHVWSESNITMNFCLNLQHFQFSDLLITNLEGTYY